MAVECTYLPIPSFGVNGLLKLWIIFRLHSGTSPLQIEDCGPACWPLKKLLWFLQTLFLKKLKKQKYNVFRLLVFQNYISHCQVWKKEEQSSGLRSVIEDIVTYMNCCGQERGNEWKTWPWKIAKKMKLVDAHDVHGINKTNPILVTSCFWWMSSVGFWYSTLWCCWWKSSPIKTFLFVLALTIRNKQTTSLDRQGFEILSLDGVRPNSEWLVCTTTYSLIRVITVWLQSKMVDNRSSKLWTCHLTFLAKGFVLFQVFCQGTGEIVNWFIHV